MTLMGFPNSTIKLPSMVGLPFVTDAHNITNLAKGLASTAEREAHRPFSEPRHT